jgi:DNA invertase Pin-like site-specific DNA recombinase
MTTEALKLDAYIRVSRVGGRSGESFISPSVQREQIEAWAKSHGALVTWHEPELDASGGTMKRPVFEAIMERVRAGQSDGVIVAKLDRFARTLVGALATLEQFERHGAVLVSVADNLDLSTAMGKAFLRILLVFAELERDRSRDSWQVATANAVARGIHIAKFTPFGYEKGPDKRLVPSHEAPAVHEAFLMRAAHCTRTEVALRLDEIAPRPEEGRWTIPMVERIIKNRVYLGYAYRGEHVNRSAHPPIVTPAEWQAANLATVRAGPRGKVPNLLGGIVRCAACRYVLAPGRTHFGGRDVPNYRCRRLHTAGACSQPASVDARKVERYVESLWREQMAREAVAVQQDSKGLQDAAEQLSLAEEELSAFAADTTARRLLGSGYHPALEERTAAVRRAQAQLNRVLACTPRGGSVETYDELTIEERKRVLGSSIDAVIVGRGHSRVPIEQRVTILWRGEGPQDLPRRGRENGPVRPYIP